MDGASACRYSRSLLGLERDGWVAAQDEGCGYDFGPVIPCSVVFVRSHEHCELDGFGTWIRLRFLGKDEADIRHRSEGISRGYFMVRRITFPPARTSLSTSREQGPHV